MMLLKFRRTDANDHSIQYDVDRILREDRYHEWMIDRGERFHDAFYDRIQNL